MFAQWRAQRDNGLWPRAGGWEAQPIRLLSHFRVFDLVENTYRAYRAPEPDISKLSPLQFDIIKWLEDLE